MLNKILVSFFVDDDLSLNFKQTHPWPTVVTDEHVAVSALVMGTAKSYFLGIFFK